MGRKEVLEKRLMRLKSKKQKLTERALSSQDAAEVRGINEQLEDVNAEIEETEEEISMLADDTGEPVNDPGADPQQRGFTPVLSEPDGMTTVRGAYSQQTNLSGQPVNTDPYATMEYRNAFKDYVQRGTPIPAHLTQRAAGDPGPTVAADLGMIIPTTIMNEFIKKISKVYGKLYAKVRKLNIQGGVKVPISDLKANFKWVTETTVADREKAGDIKEYVEFSYNIGEIRVSQTLLSQVVALSLFEEEITRIMVEAYVEAMDKGIISGTGAGQMLGILKDTRVTSQEGHIIELSEEEFSDWTAWRKKLFAKIPISKRGQGEFIFTAGTVESNLLTMKDLNNRPVFRDGADLIVNEDVADGRFYGREVTMVEPDVVSDFDSAADGDVVGVYWIPNDYAINTNLAFGMKRYFDDEKNEWVNKGLTIVDGKILDPAGCYIIKKKTTNPASE